MTQIQTELAELNVLEAEVALIKEKKLCDPKKILAFKEAKRAYVKKIAEIAKADYERGLVHTFEMTNLMRYTEDELTPATTLAERAALAEKRLKNAKENLVLLKAKKEEGRGSQVGVELAEISVIEAEQAVLRAKNP